MSVADYDIYIKEVSEKVSKRLDKQGSISISELYDIALNKEEFLNNYKTKENKKMKRTKSQIEKEIVENVNESDVLQKANVILESMKTEELKKENPNSFTFEHGNDYLAHLKAIYMLNVLQESNREKIGELGMEYINLKKELLGYDT